MSDDDDFQSAESAVERDNDSEDGAGAVKRKRDEQGDEERKSSKRAAKRKKKNAKKAAAKGDTFDDIDEELSVNRAVAQMDASLTADFIARQTKRFEEDLSLVELEDRRIPADKSTEEAAFADTSAWEGTRALENLPSFLEKHCNKSRKKMSRSPTEAKGSPHTLVITAAGLRAADITRVLRVYQSKDAMVAKLFAKHIKLKEAVELMKSTRINIGVGTPQRILDLTKDGAMSLGLVSHIVVDASHVNQKRRGILDMRETLAPLTQLLSTPDMRRRYTVGDVGVVIF